MKRILAFSIIIISFLTTEINKASAQNMSSCKGKKVGAACQYKTVYGPMRTGKCRTLNIMGSSNLTCMRDEK